MFIPFDERKSYRIIFHLQPLRAFIYSINKKNYTKAIDTFFQNELLNTHNHLQLNYLY